MCRFCEQIPEYPKMNKISGNIGISIYNNHICICTDPDEIILNYINYIPITYCPFCGKELSVNKSQASTDNITIIYTDGAFRPSVGQGGWAYVVIENNKLVFTDYDGALNVTNNIMELYAVLRALTYIIKAKCSKSIIYTDSQYVFGCATKGWKRNKNVKLWEYFDKYMNNLTNNAQEITIQWVKGHADNIFNNKADELAVKGSKLVL